MSSVRCCSMCIMTKASSPERKLASAPWLRTEPCQCTTKHERARVHAQLHDLLHDDHAAGDPAEILSLANTRANVFAALCVAAHWAQLARQLGDTEQTARAERVMHDAFVRMRARQHVL